ncbi:MAG TPA: pyridoxamine 5'-phosphate oxidase family protein [Acidimicrobiales bacterium]|nr:pyridoxamine 5'-phosphate oxidase family protein [Acidimicrobiales bacterium]
MPEPRAQRPYMPDYGVDTPPWAPLPWSWAAERLTANRNYWVVTVSAEPRPHALPVWGVWDDAEGRFAFSCGQRARKLRNLAANPLAVVMVDSTVECVSVEGSAAPVRNDERREEWIKRYLAKYEPMAPGLSADFLRHNVMVEFAAERGFGVIERGEEFSTRATRWVFEPGS